MFQGLDVEVEGISVLWMLTPSRFCCLGTNWNVPLPRVPLCRAHLDRGL